MPLAGESVRTPVGLVERERELSYGLRPEQTLRRTVPHAWTYTPGHSGGTLRWPKPSAWTRHASRVPLGTLRRTEPSAWNSSREPPRASAQYGAVRDLQQMNKRAALVPPPMALTAPDVGARSLDDAHAAYACANWRSGCCALPPSEPVLGTWPGTNAILPGTHTLLAGGDPPCARCPCMPDGLGAACPRYAALENAKIEVLAAPSGLSSGASLSIAGGWG